MTGSRAPLGPLLRRDAARAASAAVVGLAVLAVAEWVLSVALAQGPIGILTLPRFFLLDLTLVAILGVLVIPLAAVLGAGARALASLVAPDRAREWPLFGDPHGHAHGREAGPGRVAPWLWAGALTAAAYAAASVGLTLVFVAKFKEKVLIAVSLAALQLGLILILGGVAFLLAVGFRRLGGALHRRLGRANPFARVLPALALLSAVFAFPVWLLLSRLPQLRQVAPWREILSFAVFVAATAWGARVVGRRGRLLPADPVHRRRVVAGIASAFLVVAPLTLWKLGADGETKYLAMTASPTLSHLVDLVRRANDFDGDGYGSLLGEKDCAPFDARIHPNARDLPDNGIDENCTGRDLTSRALAGNAGEKLPVPEAYRRDWNFLLLTIDTVRYDHTSFGGYMESRGRDTTPRLAELARRSVSFSFAQAPSAGTMASVPAILTSKFFHSGIALSGERKPKPPKVLESNTTIAEVLKRKGYKTGAILTHEYFEDWGLDQGMDTYDNELGQRHDPFQISAHAVTDKAQAWIARQREAKWFLWAHYLDPHGRYVAHPGEKQFGTSEEDLYDGELYYTDKHIGRLLDFLSRHPAGARTIVIVTSDHGDGFREHGFINHGMALYKELIHVPLIVYVPDVEPRVVDGPVSALDVLPTIADLAGIDISDLSVEGESLVPQIFHGRDARNRIVFAETNWPDPLRAAISNDYKLIYNLKANVYQLFDLRVDPWEKKNLWGKDIAGGQRMKEHLDAWLDRVYFARDPASQAHKQRAEVLLPSRPTPRYRVDATFAGAIRLLGWETDLDAAVAGRPIQVTVYFESVAVTDRFLKLAVEVTPSHSDSAVAGAVAAPAAPRVHQERYPADGRFPTSRWRPGDFVKETFTLRVPADWRTSSVRFTLRLHDDPKRPAPVQGPAASPDGTHARLGDLPLLPPTAGPAVSGPPPTPTAPALR